jgi:hypothetical protein
VCVCCCCYCIDIIICNLCCTLRSQIPFSLCRDISEIADLKSGFVGQWLTDETASKGKCFCLPSLPGAVSRAVKRRNVTLTAYLL